MTSGEKDVPKLQSGDASLYQENMLSKCQFNMESTWF